MEDWRIIGSEDHLKDIVLYKVNFPDFWKDAYESKNAFYQMIVNDALDYVNTYKRGEEYLEGEKVQHFWHAHCDFCRKKIMTDERTEFYCTNDLKTWICCECLDDFKDKFNFNVKPSEELFKK